MKPKLMEEKNCHFHIFAEKATVKEQLVKQQFSWLFSTLFLSFPNFLSHNRRFLQPLAVQLSSWPIISSHLVTLYLQICLILQQLSPLPLPLCISKAHFTHPFPWSHLSSQHLCYHLALSVQKQNRHGDSLSEGNRADNGTCLKRIQI